MSYYKPSWKDTLFLWSACLLAILTMIIMSGLPWTFRGWWRC